MTTSISVKMETIRIETFIENYDEILERIENGERFLILSEYGEFEIISKNLPSNFNDEIDIYRNHNEAP